MIDPVRELKVRAEILHRAAQRAEAPALKRLRVLAELRGADDDALRIVGVSIQRKHCLLAVSRELGFANWDHARRVFEGSSSESDFGTILYGACRGHLNRWFASYEEARAIHLEVSTEASRAFLLAYRRQFFIVDRHFIEALGLDADDADWQAIGWDWAHPLRPDARRRLYGRILTARQRL